MPVRIRGLPAVLLLLASGAFTVFRGVTARADLEDGAAQELSRWLRAEYAREQLRGIDGVEGVTSATLDSVLATQNVTFASIEARGRADDLIVRAEVLVDGRPPTNGTAVRHYRMSYSTITGWHMKREVHPLLHYVKLF